MADAGGISENRSFDSERGAGFEGTEKGNISKTIFHFSRRQYSIAKPKT